VIEFGTGEQWAWFLPRVRAGKGIWCEPGGQALWTRARRDGEVFVVDECAPLDPGIRCDEAVT
jgi:hypothetical protein